MSDELVTVATLLCCGLLLGALLEAERRGLLHGGETWNGERSVPSDESGRARPQPTTPKPVSPRAWVAILPTKITLTPGGEPIAWGTPASVANCRENDALVAETISALWRPFEDQEDCA